MLQDKFLSDKINYRKHGLKYALEQISKDYICKNCGKKHRNTGDVHKCCN